MQEACRDDAGGGNNLLRNPERGLIRALYGCGEAFAKSEMNDLDSRGFKNIERVARSKWEMLEAAIKIEDLRSPPANRLEALKGNRLGQYSIRINDQFRLCFKWASDGAFDVEIVDYH